MDEEAKEAYEPRPYYVKQLIWDIIPHEDARELMEIMALIPPSDEGWEMEHQSAHKRQEVADSLSDTVVQTTLEALEVYVNYMVNSPDGKLPEWIADDKFAVSVQLAIHHVVRGVISSLISAEVLTVNRK